MIKIKFVSLFTVILAVAIVFSLTSFVVTKAQQNQGGQNQFTTQNQEQNQEENQYGIEDVDKPKPPLISPLNETNEELPGGVQGQVNAEQHRSRVANFVQSLLNVADREPGGIGEQVRVIAQQQNQSASTTVQAMEKVQTRNRIMTFLFGSDYRNLGVLRSEMVQTRNRLEQLNRLMENVQNEDDQTELQNQIQALEQEQERIENFIKEQEGKFSLFGWLIRLFNR